MKSFKIDINKNTGAGFKIFITWQDAIKYFPAQLKGYNSKIEKDHFKIQKKDLRVAGWNGNETTDVECRCLTWYSDSIKYHAHEIIDEYGFSLISIEKEVK